MKQELVDEIIEYVSNTCCYFSTMLDEPELVSGVMIGFSERFIDDNQNDETIKFYNSMVHYLYLNQTLEESLNRALIPYLMKKLQNDGFKQCFTPDGTDYYKK